MRQRPIMDAGPGLNFFSINKERLLFGTVGPLSIPEVVEQEIIRKSGQDQRFTAAERVLRKIPSRYLEILRDDPTTELATAVSRITGIPFHDRMRTSKDLGEIMVVAHAVVAAERGDDLLVLIDDSGGRRLAMAEAERLQRKQRSGTACGGIRLVNTTTVLRNAAGKDFLPDKSALRAVYAKLRQLNDGLAPLETAGLLDLPCWT
ncbi:hypothetical protein [Citricoccus muralis]|uniref:PIN domain-containing protein n=1 Tax=Citricoccus muralis TaxID=169134 RepID=A0ABY8H6B8_9MICC|nr:hypothetical protein [Citricoccus muralis]WFP16684.1 hypothetical protein P8192_00725 [Citricoccus muralis]